jgi:CRP/FNR family transcriptional regulator
MVSSAPSQELYRMDDYTLEPFLHLSPQGQRKLAQSMHLYHFPEAQQLIHKGQQVSGAYLVTQGKLRVFTFTEKGTEATLYFINEGETCVLALNCLFNNLLYPAWVECDDDTRVAVIPGNTYRSLFQSETSVQNVTVKALSTVVFRLMGELEQIHSFTLDQRLANFILTHASGEGVLTMTQQAIASHLGTSREVIARLVRGLVAEGCISTGRGRISVRDSKKLSTMVMN